MKFLILTLLTKTLFRPSSYPLKPIITCDHFITNKWFSMKRIFDLSKASNGKLLLIVLALYGTIAIVTYFVWQ